VGRCIRAGKFKGLALSIAALGQIYGGGGGGGGNSRACTDYYHITPWVRANDCQAKGASYTLSEEFLPAPYGLAVVRLWVPGESHRGRSKKQGIPRSTIRKVAVSLLPLPTC
jgi:hypothetical protein